MENENLEECEKTEKKQLKNWFEIFIAAVALILTFIIIFSVYKPAATIDKNEYDKIEIGMTMSDVYDIIGGKPAEIQSGINEKDFLALDYNDRVKYNIENDTTLTREEKENVKAGIENLLNMYIKGYDYTKSKYYKDENVLEFWNDLKKYDAEEDGYLRLTWKTIPDRTEMMGEYYQDYANIYFEDGLVVNKTSTFR